MMGKIASVLADYLTEIGFDVGKDFIVTKKEEKEIRSELRQYIENQRKYNEMCSLAEEIDFEGILEYLKGSFMDDIHNRLFGKKKERGLARKTIISKAVGYSSATTDEAKKRTAKFVANAVDILYNYYRNQSKREDLLIAAEVEDTVIDEIKRSEKNLRDHIDKASLFSIDSYLHLAQRKDFETIEDDGGFATVDEEISFLEKIILLENYFHKPIKIPNDIYEKDIDSIDYLTKLIENEKAELTWKGGVLTILVKIDEAIKKHLSDLDESPQRITVYGNANVNLFDEIYHLPIIRTFESAIIRDLGQVKKKVEVLEADDILKLKYIPGASDILIDSLDL